MNDIVQRLREVYSPSTAGSVAIMEAADEIERLRKLIDGAAETGEVYERRLSECEAEIERLRQRVAELEARDIESARRALEVAVQMDALVSDLRARLAAAERERDAAKRVISGCWGQLEIIGPNPPEHHTLHDRIGLALTLLCDEQKRADAAEALLREVRHWLDRGPHPTGLLPRIENFLQLADSAVQEGQ